jgi:LacI family transcriptional regulator
MNVSIKDIALKCNLSTSTVSRALNAQYGVNQKTRDKVLQAVKELGYVPNLFAKELVNKKSNLVGLLILDSSMGEARPAFFELLPSINKTLSLYGKNTVISAIDPFTLQEGELEKIIKMRNLCGIILFPGLQHPYVINEIRNTAVPAVILEEDLILKHCSSISTDENLGTELVVKQLFKNGHKEIGFVNGPAEIGICQKRLTGFKNALEKYGISFTQERVIHSDFTGKGGGQSTLELIEKDPSITAIFIANDLMAMGAISILSEKGFNIPNDVSIIGYDGLYMTPYFNPPLSTIKIDNREIGIRTAELLVELINGATGRALVIKPALQEGKTVKKINGACNDKAIYRRGET